jgi:drug/metabolite transporter (DMT)-like permease
LRLWTNLWIIYVVWGSTYLAIRVMVETVPPLLSSGARFGLAGLILLTFLVARHGVRRIRITRTQVLGLALVGLLLPGANAVVSVAETDVPSGLAALIVAAIPLFVILLRALAREPISGASIAGVAVGFVGVALLMLPGERPDGASTIGMLALVGAAFMWATGSFASPKLDLPKDPWVSTGWNMLLGGLIILIAGLLAGEGSDVHPGEWATDSILAFVYLVTVGSLIAYSAYVWLLQNAPVSKVSTYAYVNPVIAVFLGWLILSETITSMTLIGAAIIVASVMIVVRTESGTAARRASRARSASASA